MSRLILAAAALVGLATGCVVHGHGPGYVHPVYGPAVSLDVAHVHSDHCGHFHHGGYWYHARGHRHGPGCGHVHRRGVWIIGE